MGRDPGIRDPGIGIPRYDLFFSVSVMLSADLTFFPYNMAVEFEDLLDVMLACNVVQCTYRP